MFPATEHMVVAGGRSKQIPLSQVGLGNNKNSSRGRDIFLDLPLYRTWAHLWFGLEAMKKNR
jgi:hypothetical protein